MARTICLRLLTDCVRAAASRTLSTDGTNKAARTARTLRPMKPQMQSCIHVHTAPPSLAMESVSRLKSSLSHFDFAACAASANSGVVTPFSDGKASGATALIASDDTGAAHLGQATVLPAESSSACHCVLQEGHSKWSIS